MWLRLCGVYVSVPVSLNSIQIAADKILSRLVAEKFSYVSLCHCVSVTVCVYVCLFMCMRFCMHFSVSMCMCTLYVLQASVRLINLIS